MTAQGRAVHATPGQHPGEERARPASELAVRRWLVAAPFLQGAASPWLHSFVDPRLGFRFEVVARPDTTGAAGPTTSARVWRHHLQHAMEVVRRARAGGEPTGIVTCFPQLAATVGLCKRLGGARLPVVAWNFNLGTLPGGLRRDVARFALGAVDRFIVHASAEVEPYAAWLGGRPGRVRFVPLQQCTREVEVAEEAVRPFVLAMGSAHRDYRTFAQAMAEAGLRAVVVAAPHALQGVDFPPNVEVRTGLSIPECDRLVQQARVVVVPVDNESTASGQVAVLTAMMYGRPVVATRCVGTVDYVRDGIDGVLVPRGDARALAQQVASLWPASALRQALGRRARERVAQEHSDPAIGAALASVLAEVGAQSTRSPR